jgi:hypothetical protein
MTEPPALPSPVPAVPASDQTDEPPPPPPPPRPRRDVVPWLYSLGFLVLAAAIFYLWQNTPTGNAPPLPVADLQPVEQQLTALESRVATLEEQQRPAGSDLTPRVEALERRTAAVDVGSVAARVEALERRPAPPDTAPLLARLAALEQRVAANSQAGERYDILAGRIDALSGKEQSGATELSRRVDAEEARLGKLEQSIGDLQQTAGKLSALAEKGSRLARIQTAEAALAAGRPLGELPGAAKSLTRFATSSPPTMAALRLAFPDAEQAALAASRPDTQGKPLLDRMWQRAQTLVTVRQGDEVLVGNTAAGILARAHTALDAGDLGGAVAAVSELQGPPAQAIAGWLDEAQALLDARAALADMAEHA